MYSNYQKFLLTGDFNPEVSDHSDHHLETFLNQHELKSLSNEKMCFKSILNLRCIDLFSTHNSPLFQNTKIVSTGLSDFRKLVVTVLKTSIVKSKPREMQSRNYNFFNSRKFNRYLTEEFPHKCVDSCNKLDEIFLKVLNRHAPLKKKTLRANNATYVSKAL